MNTIADRGLDAWPSPAGAFRARSRGPGRATVKAGPPAGDSAPSRGLATVTGVAIQSITPSRHHRVGPTESWPCDIVMPAKQGGEFQPLPAFIARWRARTNPDAMPGKSSKPV